MKSKIVIQPNGLYCIFSTQYNRITHYNLSKSILLKLLDKHYKSKSSIQRVINSAINPNSKSYLDFDTAIKLHFQNVNLTDAEALNLKCRINGEDTVEYHNPTIKHKSSKIPIFDTLTFVIQNFEAIQYLNQVFNTYSKTLNKHGEIDDWECDLENILFKNIKKK